ncbi:MAG TPA: hypothetical protein VIM69_10595 [Opitutaceae bacterium]
MALTKVDNDMISGLTKADVGLDNVDNTADSAKPVSTAVQTALDLKAPLASPTFTGIVSGVTKSMVGLGNVDNTSDAAKPVSTATQTALDLKANLASPALTGTPTAPTAAADTNTTQIATTAYVQGELTDRAPLASPTFTGTPAAPTAAADTNTTQIATTAYVQGELTDRAPLASPAFTGTPTAPTAATTTNTTQIASTAFVQQEIAAVTGGAVTGPGSSTNNSVAGWNGTGGTVLKELTAAQIRDAADLDIGDSPQFTAINLGHASDTTLARVSAGVVSVEGSNILLASGIGSITQAWDADLDAIKNLTPTNDDFLQRKSSAWANRTPTQVTADLIAVVGDSGSGGTKGLVPAPSAGDAAANKYLKASGAWAAVSAGAMEYIGAVTASAQASIEFTGLSTSYDEFVIVLQDVILSGGSVLALTVSDNNGSSYLSANYSYSTLIAGGTPAGAGGSSQAQITLVTTSPSTGDQGLFGEVQIFTGDTGTFRCTSMLAQSPSSAGLKLGGGGVALSGTKVNAVKLAPLSGTMTGNAKLFGVRNS